MPRDSLQHAPHMIVATPGRLLDHLQKGTVSLDALNTLVMDEADRMLYMGFSDAFDDVIRFAPASSLQHAPHMIVATPGRLLDHLQKGTVSLDALNTLVMDEADRMLYMGFSDAFDDVIRFAPASRQTLLFSATWPEAIAAISGRVQRDPLAIEID